MKTDANVTDTQIHFLHPSFLFLFLGNFVKQQQITLTSAVYLDSTPVQNDFQFAASENLFKNKMLKGKKIAVFLSFIQELVLQLYNVKDEIWRWQ